jgi:putative endonuclease
MSHFLYILYSKSKDKFYIGETHAINERLNKHNNHYYKNSFTKIASDWEVCLTFECENQEKIRFLEQFIKKMKSKVFIKKIIQNPLILEDILFKNGK